jgi:hypothetical protein
VARRRETDSIPWPLVRSALDRGDLEWLRQSADRLAPVRLTDALRICLIIRDREPVQYERAAMRWLSRFALEARNATLTDLRRAAEALGSLPEDANTAMEELATLCRRYELPGC